MNSAPDLYTMPTPISHATRRMLREIDAYKKSPEYLRAVFEDIQRTAREKQEMEDSVILPLKVLNDFTVDLESGEMRLFQSYASLTIKSIFERRPLPPRFYFHDAIKQQE